MTKLTRWTAFPELHRPRVSRVFDEAFRDFLTPLAPTEDVAEGRWLPAVDIRETEEALTLLVELPGLSKEDVNIGLEDRVLTISGERKFEKETEEENYHRIERSYGHFSRSFSLPTNLSVQDVTASFDAGILKIGLPRAEEAKPKKIEIK